MGKIRIIGGIHRSRQLSVLNLPGLRPTLDRVKETLFNWLGQDLTGKRCLDLFAGSGSLSFEAISRNATEVVMVEKCALVADLLKQNIELLHANNCTLYHEDAFNLTQRVTTKFDVIFLDPPYQDDLLNKVLPEVARLLSPDGVCYIECLKLPEMNGYRMLKQAKAGSVIYALLTLSD